MFGSRLEGLENDKSGDPNLRATDGLERSVVYTPFIRYVRQINHEFSCSFTNSSCIRVYTGGWPIAFIFLAIYLLVSFMRAGYSSLCIIQLNYRTGYHNAARWELAMASPGLSLAKALTMREAR